MVQVGGQDWVPRLRGNLQCFRLSTDSYSVVSEYDTYLLEGAPLCAVLSLIDGVRTAGDIYKQVAPACGAAPIDHAFSILLDAGYIEPSAARAAASIEAFCNELKIGFAQAKDLLTQRAVELVNLSSLSSDLVADLLQDSGVRLAGEAAFTLVICDDYRDPRLQRINHEALRGGRPWLIAKPGGHNHWLGPLFLPGRSPCWQCMDQRLTRNRNFVAFAERISNQRELIKLNLSPIASCLYQALGALVVQVLRVALDRFDPADAHTLYVFDALSRRSSRHAIVRRPQCPACGAAPAVGIAHAIPVNDETQGEQTLGGVRREAPEFAFERFQHHISPLTGIVSAVEPSPYNGTTPLRVFSAGHNFALANTSITAVKDSLRALSSGKGRTSVEARTSALCEALERYSGMYQGDETRRRASYRALGEEALHPNEFLLFSDRQYANRDHWNQDCTRFQVVPLQLDPDRPIEWSPVQTLDGQRTRYVPTSHLYYGYPSPPEEFFCWADSNGCAGGASREDAILQGLLELVERDAVAVWWYNRLSRPSRMLEDIGDDYYDRLAAFYHRIGRSVWLVELTHDLGIPAYAALSRRESGPSEDIIIGFGAHLCPDIAVNRAVTEMNQFMPAVLNVGTDGVTRYQFDDAAALHWWRSGTIAGQPYLSHPSVSNSRWARQPRLRADSGAQTLERVAALILKAGLEVFVADQSRPDIGLPVYKVMVPGLRHFWSRFREGRLYTVPVAMGALQTPLDEADLNPIPMFV